MRNFSFCSSYHPIKRELVALTDLQVKLRGATADLPNPCFSLKSIDLCRALHWWIEDSVREKKQSVHRAYCLESVWNMTAIKGCMDILHRKESGVNRSIYIEWDRDGRPDEAGARPRSVAAYSNWLPKAGGGDADDDESLPTGLLRCQKPRRRCRVRRASAICWWRHNCSFLSLSLSLIISQVKPLHIGSFLSSRFVDPIAATCISILGWINHRNLTKSLLRLKVSLMAHASVTT